MKQIAAILLAMSLALITAGCGAQGGAASASSVESAASAVSMPEPESAEGFFDQAMVSADEGQYEQAIELLTRAIELDPEFFDAYRERAMNYLSIEDTERASGDFIAAAKLCAEQNGRKAGEEFLKEVRNCLRFNSELNELFVQFTMKDESAPPDPNRDYFPNGQLMTEREYGQDGRLEREVWYEMDGSEDTYYLFDYDENGRTTAKRMYDSDGTRGPYFLYDYDTNGNLIRENNYRSDDSLADYTEFQYDANGNKIRADWYVGGTLGSYTTYEYGAGGDLAKELYCTAEGRIEIEYLYDENGNLIQKTQYEEDGSVFSKYAYEYHENGVRKKETSYEVDGTISYEINYDEEGNYINQD